MAAKRSHSDKHLKVKYQVLQELKKGPFQKDLAEKNAIPPNAISSFFFYALFKVDTNFLFANLQ